MEEEQVVEFSRNDDKLGIYIPKGTGYPINSDLDVFNIGTTDKIVYLGVVSGKYNHSESVITKNIIVFNDEEMTLTATLKFID